MCCVFVFSYCLLITLALPLLFLMPGNQSLVTSQCTFSWEWASISQQEEGKNIPCWGCGMDGWTCRIWELNWFSSPLSVRMLPYFSPIVSYFHILKPLPPTWVFVVCILLPEWTCISGVSSEALQFSFLWSPGPPITMVYVTSVFHLSLLQFPLFL